MCVCLLQGLHTDTPYLQIGSVIFKGEYKETVGTDMVFEVRPKPGAS